MPRTEPEGGCGGEPAAVAFRGISKAFGGVPVLRDFDLDIPAGQRLVIHLDRQRRTGGNPHQQQAGEQQRSDIDRVHAGIPVQRPGRVPTGAVGSV